MRANVCLCRLSPAYRAARGVWEGTQPGEKSRFNFRGLVLQRYEGVVVPPFKRKFTARTPCAWISYVPP